MERRRRLPMRRTVLIFVCTATLVATLLAAPAAEAALKTIRGNGRANTLRGTARAERLLGLGGNDRLYGHGGNDVLDGGAGSNYLHGGKGDDLLIASKGANVYDGGSGNDVLDFSGLDGTLSADVSKHTASVTSAGGEVVSSATFKSVETIVGGKGDDTFVGNSHDNAFAGGAGNDTFRGKGGADTFTGGEGSDTFVWYKKDVKDGLADHITDFNAKEDHFDFSDFLKGSGIKNVTLDDVIHVKDMADGSMIQAHLKDGGWVDVVQLDGVHLDAAHLHDVLMHH